MRHAAGLTVIFSAVLVTSAFAQSVDPKTVMSSQQIQDLISGLRVIDQGTTEQCGPTPSAKDAKEEKGAPRPCPYHKSASLIRAMARNIVALQPVDSEFKIQQNAIRLEVLAAEQPGPKQDAAFFDRMMKVYAEQHQVPGLVRIKLADLDLGAAPEHNQIPAVVVASLAPIIDDFAQTAEK